MKKSLFNSLFAILLVSTSSHPIVLYREKSVESLYRAVSGVVVSMAIAYNGALCCITQDFNDRVKHGTFALFLLQDKIYNIYTRVSLDQLRKEYAQKEKNNQTPSAPSDSPSRAH